jgi:hypothetical protein
MTRRICFIRQLIAEHGGNPYVYSYYADNSKGSQVHYNSHDDDINYKVYRISKDADWLTPEQRASVVAELNKHPDVKKAYLSEGYCPCPSGHSIYNDSFKHIKVRFRS